MKTRDQKYKEAVARNLNSAGTYNKKRYISKGLEESKRRLGIKQSDTEYNERVMKIIGGAL